MSICERIEVGKIIVRTHYNHLSKTSNSASEVVCVSRDSVMRYILELEAFELTLLTNPG